MFSRIVSFVLLWAIYCAAVEDPCSECPSPCKKVVAVNNGPGGLEVPPELTGYEHDGMVTLDADGSPFCVGQQAAVEGCDMIGIEPSGSVVERAHLTFAKIVKLQVFCEQWPITVCVGEDEVVPPPTSPPVPPPVPREPLVIGKRSCKECPKPCKKPVIIGPGEVPKGIKMSKENGHGERRIRKKGGESFCLVEFVGEPDCTADVLEEDMPFPTPYPAAIGKKTNVLTVTCKVEGAKWSALICCKGKYSGGPVPPTETTIPPTIPPWDPIVIDKKSCKECPKPCKKPVIISPGNVPKGIKMGKENGHGERRIRKKGGEPFCLVEFVGDPGCTAYVLEEDMPFGTPYPAATGRKTKTLIVECKVKGAKWEALICCKKEKGSNVPPETPGTTVIPPGTVTEVHLDASHSSGEGKIEKGACKGCPKPCEKKLVVKNLSEDKTLGGKVYKKGQKMPPSVVKSEGDPCLIIELANGEGFCLKTLYLKVEKNKQKPTITGTLTDGTVVSGDPSGMKLTRLNINCDGESKITDWIIVICVEKNTK